MIRPPHNRVLVVLSMAALLTLALLSVVSVQPNRIAPGEDYSLVAIVGFEWLIPVLLPLVGVVCLSWWSPPRWGDYAMLTITLVYLVSWPWALSLFCQMVVDSSQQAARASIGPGLWAWLFFSLLILLELQARLHVPRFGRWSLWLSLIALISLPFWLGALSDLALVREYQGNTEQFMDAMHYHVALVSAVVAVSLMLAVLLALLMRSHERLQRGVFAVLSVIQTIPSLALFGLLLAPLAWLSSRFSILADLGVQGIGWAPALLALVGYSLLPMTRNTYVALESIDPQVIDAARGMGMSRWQVFFQVRLPLALPVIIEGVRITSVQAIGLAAVAALIGAGGFGTFVFQGLGQAAMDMVLLGALPIIIMAVLVDTALSALAAWCRRGDVNA